MKTFLIIAVSLIVADSSATFLASGVVPSAERWAE